MKILLIGRAHNCPDFIAYCQTCKIEITIIDEKDWQQAMKLCSDEYAHVVAFSDAAQVFVSKINQLWERQHRDQAILSMLTDKSLMRQNQEVSPILPSSIVFKASVDVEKIIQFVREQQHPLPLIVKPAHGFYSAGVVRVDSMMALARAVAIARRVNQQVTGKKGSIIVEEYLEGDEIAIDGIIYDGQPYPLVRHMKYPKLEGPFFHEEAYITELIAPHYSEKDVIERFIKTVGLKSGPFHLEMRQGANGQWRLLECAPRFSGMGLSTNLPFQMISNKHAYDYLLRPEELPRLSRERYSQYVLEYDFSVPKSGILTGLDVVKNKILQHCDCKLFCYANEGDYVLSPPENISTILTVFHKVNTFPEALSAFNYFNSLKGDLVQ